MCIIGMLSFQSCDDFLDIQPTGKVIAKTSEEYRALLTSVYNNFPDDRSLTTLRTDEMTLDPASTTTEDLNSYFDIWVWNDVTKDENTSSYNWRRFYHSIYIANYIIEHQNEITEGTADEINQMVGESYMIRAYCHFVLVNLFGEPYTFCDPSKSLSVPLSIKADVDAVLTRSTVGDIYNQIVKDIAEARKYMKVTTWEEDYRYRFNTISIDAFEARVQLYMGNWNEALKASKAVIESHPELEDLTQSSYTLPDNYKSKEAIVSLEQVMKSSYKRAGYPSKDIINLYRTGDVRKNRYFKQKSIYLYDLQKGGDALSRSTFRSAEAYLTAAEAAARMGNLDTAIEYLKPIVQTRYMAAIQPTVISEYEAMDQEALINAILKERTCELCFEGHRWFDLRRTTQQSITKVYEGVEYILDEHDSRYTMPIPNEAINANPNLGK